MCFTQKREFAIATAHFPQLMNFLLHGAPDDATHLEVFLLDRAEKYAAIYVYANSLRNASIFAGPFFSHTGCNGF